MTSPKPFCRTDALDAGITDTEIRRAVRTGELERLDPGIYLHSYDAAELDETGRHRIRVLSAAAQLVPGSVISHVSAAILHGLPLGRADLRRVHITRDGRGGGRRSAGRHVHVAPLGADEVVHVDGVPCTSVARTIVDLACTVPIDDVVVVGDSALSSEPLLATEIDRVLDSIGRRQGIAAARRIVAFLDGRSESPGESLSRLRMQQFSMPAPSLQEVVLTPGGEFVARTDFFWKEHRIVGEFDGMGKYDADGRSAIRREKRREDALRDLGFEVVRWTWAELSRFSIVQARFARALVRSRT